MKFRFLRPARVSSSRVSPPGPSRWPVEGFFVQPAGGRWRGAVSGARPPEGGAKALRGPRPSLAARPPPARERFVLLLLLFLLMMVTVVLS